MLQERAAGVGCFSHVWSLSSRAKLFSNRAERLVICQKERERNMDGRKTGRASTENAARFDTFL